MFGGGEGVFPKQHNEILSGYGMLTVKREGGRGNGKPKVVDRIMGLTISHCNLLLQVPLLCDF